MSDNSDKKFNETICFTNTGEFRFGRFKNSKLNDIYKCCPNYINWCLVKLNGFVIYPSELEILRKEMVFNFDYMEKFTEENESFYNIDLRSFSRNDNGFLIKKDLPETAFTFDLEAIASNNNKLSHQNNMVMVMKGSSNYDKLNQELPKAKSSKKINILVP